MLAKEKLSSKPVSSNLVPLLKYGRVCGEFDLQTKSSTLFGGQKIFVRDLFR